MGSQVFDVDLLAFERGNDVKRKSIVDGVMRSLETGFVYSAHDISYNFLKQRKKINPLEDRDNSEDKNHLGDSHPALNN